MSEDKYEKPPPTAPPLYSTLYPTGNPQPDNVQYGFQTPSQPGLLPQYNPGYMPQGYNQPQTQYNPGISPTVVSQPAVVTQPTVVIMGGCPTCRVGVLEDDYTCCGILCAICFFPIGILCCLAMKEKRCTNCKASF